MTTELAERAIALAAEGRTTAEVAAELGCTYATAVRLIQQAAIPRRPGRRLPDGSILLELDRNGVTGSAIAATYGVSPASVSMALKRARAQAEKINAAT